MTTRLPCLMLPLEDRNILMPVSAVAEVIPFEEPQSILDAPAWLLGILNWRGVSVPLTALLHMDFPPAWDHLNQALPTNPKKQFIAIINRSKKIGRGDHTEPTNLYPFFAILVEGAPKLYHVDESTLKIANQFGADEKKFLMEVKIQNDGALIPHLDNLWAMIDALPSRLQWFKQIVL